jgi:hypothetical protein
MEMVRKIILKRVDGAYCDVWFKPVKSIRAAARFNDMDEYNSFLTGHYRPNNPELYKPQYIKVTYEEVDE